MLVVDIRKIDTVDDRHTEKSHREARSRRYLRVVGASSIRLVVNVRLYYRRWGAPDVALAEGGHTVVVTRAIQLLGGGIHEIPLKDQFPVAEFGGVVDHSDVGGLEGYGLHHDAAAVLLGVDVYSVEHTSLMVGAGLGGAGRTGDGHQLVHPP